jgi:hypothetical protein
MTPPSSFPSIDARSETASGTEFCAVALARSRYSFAFDEVRSDAPSLV